MAGQGNRVLISYNDVGKYSDQNSLIANQLATYLFRKGKQPDIKVYRESKVALESVYDWLILIYTSESEAKGSPVESTVEKALDLTVERSMRGVLAVTPVPAELPAKWATIRKYDASTQGEGKQVLEAVEHAMSYVKLPYTRERMQELTRTSSSALSKSQNKYPSTRSLIVASLATIMTILGVAAFFMAPLLHPTSQQQATAVISNPATATAQAKQVATAQAFKSATIVAEATAQASATAAAPSIAQKQFDKIINTSPKVTGFQSDEKWDKTASCILTPQNTAYQATVAIAGQYVRCMANTTQLKNFAYQVTLAINGDAGGVIFRSEDQTGTFYRFSLSNSSAKPNSDEFAVILCQQNCASNAVNEGTLLAQDQVSVDPNKPVILTVIARDTIIDMYVNGNFIYQLTDQPVLSGAIGVYAASINTSTSVTFTNPKVWQL